MGVNKMIDYNKFKVPSEKIRWLCSTDLFEFTCTTDVEPLKEFIGQERALESIHFGLQVEKPGYNLFLTGLSGTGKASTIKMQLQKFLSEKSEQDKMKNVYDWCYVYNFMFPDQPKILRLPRGSAREFSSDMEDLLNNLKKDIPRAFGSDEYQKQKQDILEEHQRKYQSYLDALDQEAASKSLMVQLSPSGAAVIPLANGNPLSREEFLKIPETERKIIEAKRLEMMRKVDETYTNLRELDKEIAEKMKELEQKTGNFAISRIFDILIEKYSEHGEVVNFLKESRNYTLSKIDMFLQTTGSQPAPFAVSQPDIFVAYKVNVFVENVSDNEPPIIFEPNPTWFNMFGRIERKALMGTYISDHLMMKAGAIQSANGGYLILNMRDVILNPGVWEGLKRVIRTKEVRIEDPFEQMGFFAPQGMKPQPVPVELKIIVIGDDMLYQLLMQYDEDFWEMFKVKADFDFQMPKNNENIKAYTCFIRTCCDGENLLPFDRSGVSKIIEQAVRATGDQEKLSARFGPVKDLIIESDYWARVSGSELIKGEHVQKAVDAKIHRLDLVAERILQMIADGTLMVDVTGEAIGQVNGLSVYDLGIFSFGRPNRITAKTFLGRKGVINIERESQMSGRIHDKGVLILSGYIGWKYAQDKPLSLNASICFEQSYSGVEGDSASSTELYAIISSLAEVPVKQNIAVTGSVNQKGEIQPIGGANQKIEGFFDVCKAKGLTGDQGVLIPYQNIRNLMLREDVANAIKENKFHIYAVKTIDEGIEVLTGISSGEKQPDGSFPEGTINYLVDKKLREFAVRMKEYNTITD